MNFIFFAEELPLCKKKKKTSSALLTLGKCTLQSADSVPRGAQSKLTDGLDLGPGSWTGLRGRS